MIILDTNVISEGLRPHPSARVLAWMDSQIPSDMYLCAPVLAELRYGVERLAEGKRRSELETLISNMEEDLFKRRLLAFDRDSAFEFGRIVAKRENIGRPISPMDAMIAAIARSQGMMIATRDIRDFSGLEIELINPFDIVAER